MGSHHLHVHCTCYIWIHLYIRTNNTSISSPLAHNVLESPGHTWTCGVHAVYHTNPRLKAVLISPSSAANQSKPQSSAVMSPRQYLPPKSNHVKHGVGGDIDDCGDADGGFDYTGPGQGHLCQGKAACGGDRAGMQEHPLISREVPGAHWVAGLPPPAPGPYQCHSTIRFINAGGGMPALLVSRGIGLLSGWGCESQPSPALTRPMFQPICPPVMHCQTPLPCDGAREL